MTEMKLIALQKSTTDPPDPILASSISLDFSKLLAHILLSLRLGHAEVTPIYVMYSERNQEAAYKCLEARILNKVTQR